MAREGDPAFDELPESQRADLATILPGLGGGSREEGTEAEQVRVFEALLALFDAMAEEQPLLLVIEDLHWADSSTRGFVRFLARTLCTERMLVVGTYRSDELHRRHPLRPLLAELARDPLAHLVELERLTRDEMTEQLEDILGSRADPGLVERLYSRSEGNPLFTEELLAVGLDGRGTLPPTLRDALMLRVERLSRAGAGRAALARLPVAGRRPARRADRHRLGRAARGPARGGGRPDRGRPRRRQLRLPPRPAARGGLRRPAAGRARRAARRDRAARSSARSTTRASACT